MYLRNRLFIASLVVLFNMIAAQAQTLYWVGGSGNFNDPQHWAAYPGGAAPGNLVPTASTSVVFKNQYTESTVVVRFPALAEVAGVSIETTEKFDFVGSSAASKLVVHGDFLASIYSNKISSSLEFLFSSNGNQLHTINGNLFRFKNKVAIKNGNWFVQNLLLYDGARLNISDADVKFSSAIVSAESIDISNCGLIESDNTHFTVKDKFTVGNGLGFKNDNSTLNNKDLPAQFLTFNYSNPATNNVAGKLGQNQIATTATLSSVPPSCSPGCDGKIIITVPNFTNYPSPTPTTIYITVFNGTCSAVNGLTVTAPGTYTISNVCGCTNLFSLLFEDENSNFLENPTIAVVNPLITWNPQTTSNTRSLTCPGICTGSTQVFASGGIAPYNFTVTPPSGPATFSSSSGNITQTSLCAGVYTFEARDAGNCTSLHTRTISTPSVLSTSASTRSVSCFGAANGGFSITPSGGTPNYTVVFSTGTTFSNVAANATVAVTGQGPAAITATLIDSRGCNTTTSTVITQPSNFTVSASQTTINCAGACNGTANVLVTGVSGGTGAGSYNYSWTPVTATTSSNGTLCAGPATVFITDAILGCTTSNVFTITQRPAIAFSSSVITNVVCSGAATGAFNGTITGGTPNYSVTLQNSITTLSSTTTAANLALSNLASGAYTINVTDVAGCLRTFSFFISQPTTFTITTSTQSVNCPGATNGTIGVSASGGNGAPYSYTWTPAVAGNTSAVSGVPAGTYFIAVADRSNCISSPGASVVIVEPPTFSFAVSVRTVDCRGASTGSIGVTPTGGSAPYQFTLAFGVTTQTNSTGNFTGLQGSPTGVGIYTITVADSFFPGSCAQSTTVSINQPTLSLTPGALLANPNCFSACNGALTGTNNGGGTPGYTYNWVTPTGTVLNTQTLINRCAGSYSLVIVDGRGCATTQTVLTLTQPSSITISFNTTSVSCAAGQGSSSNGGINTTISGGTLPHSFTWTPPSPGTPSTTANLSNLPAGIYTLNFTDANSCLQSAQTVTVLAPAAMVLTQNTNSTTCSTSCNGSATVTLTGGRPNFTYSYTGSSALSSTGSSTVVNFPNVCGAFTVNVTDANSCTVAITNTVGNPPVYSPVITTTLVTCFGICDGRIRTAPTGGSAPYTYTLLGTAGFSQTATAANSATFTSLCAGSYSLLIRDSNPAFCAQQFTVNVTQPVNSLTATATSTAASCFAICDGALGGSATGGSGTYTSYVWTSATATVGSQNLINRCAGSYTLRVTDSNGCQAFATTTVSQPPTLAITSSVITNVSCFGGSNGAATITAAGGPVAGAYTFSWSPSGQTAATATALTAQTQTVAISKNGCTQSFTLPVTQPAQIVITRTATNERCLSSCDGSATITIVSGGAAPFTYSVTGAPTPSNTTGIFSALCADAYSVLVTDNNGCTTNTLFTVNSPTSAVSITTVNTSPSCLTCTGRSTVTATGGLLPYSFVFTNTLSSTPASPSNSLANMCPGTYTALVTDANTCTTSLVFAVNPVVIITSVTNGTTTCFGASDGSVAVSANGGQTPYTYSWTPSAQTTPTATGLAAGVYTVRVVDANSPGCEAFAQASVTPASSITLAATITSVTCPGVFDGGVTVTATGGAGVAPYSYTWSPSASTSSIVSGATFGVQTVTVTKGTCSISASYTIGSPNPPITATLTSVSPNNCASPNNGSISVVTGGGNGTYTYTWSPNVGTASLVTNLTAGAYVVTVTSAGCSTVFTSNLTAPLAQTITPISSQSIACFSGSTGALSFSTTAPTPSYTWIPATTSITAGPGTSASNLTAGTYTLLLRDVNSCTNSITATLAQAPAIAAVSAQTNVLCFGDASGVAQATITGGTPGYTYTWSTGFNGTGSIVSVNSLTASITGAVYTATVTDAQSCPSVLNFTLTAPAPFTFTTSSSNVLCFGAANGSIAAIPTPSTGVTYSWAAVPSATFAGSTNSVITGLSAGIYTVTVSDGTCNAVGTNTVQITEPTALSASLTINHNVTCFGGNNGEATYSVSGGNGAYTYTWTGSTSTTNVASTLTVGNYTVNVSDALGCTTSTVFTITGPANFDATLTASNPLCTGAFNGSIATQVTGGQGTINYVWAPAGTGQNPTSLSAGAGIIIYTLTMSDDSLCTVVKTTTLTDPLPIGANTSFTNPTCFNVCDGAAQSTPINAMGTPTITWLPGLQTGTTVTGLCGSPTGSPQTIYTVNVVDANGCNTSSSFTLGSPSQITATYNAAPALCGQNTGSISLNSSGGTGALNYNWLSPLTGSAATQITLAVGVYSVQITDANNCTEIITIPISASNGPTATVSNSSLSCYGDATASATVSALSPTNTTIQWLTPLTATVPVVTGLTAGNYTVEITNPANNCKVYYGFSVVSPPLLSIVTSSSSATCFGICDGSVGIVTSGGVTPYNYLWVGPNGFTSTATSITNICGGDYSLTLSDANNCTVQPSFSLPVLNNIVILQPIKTINNTCFGDCAGSATIDVVGTTTTVLTHTVSWSNGFYGDIQSNLCSGIYSVLVTDTRGCSNTYSVPITSPPNFSITSVVTQPNCNQCNGGATVTASGGNGPAYTYSWTGGQTTNTLTNLCAGLYQVVVGDPQNCVQTLNLAINNSNGITGETITVQDESCFGSCNGSATITAIGGASPISYNWVNPSLSNTVNIANNLCPGPYFIQMSDANNCLRTASLSVNSAIDMTLTTFITPPSCTAVPADGALVANVQGNSGPISYSWAPIGATTFSVANVGPGTYTLTVVDQLSGCTKSTVVTVGNLTAPQYSLAYSDADCLALGSASISSTGTVALTYLWSTGATSSVVSGLQAGPLTVTVTAGSGCVGVSQLTIDAVPSVELSSTTQKIICNNDCNGGIILQAVNGFLPYTFSLSTGASGVQTGSLCAGTYTAIVFDSKGCSDTAFVNLVNPPVITFSFVSNNSSCATLADGTASITPLAGLAPYTYTITNGITTVTANPAAGLSSGNYSISIVDSLGCSAGSQTLAVVPTLTVIADAGQNLSVCANANVVISASLSVGADKFMWSSVPDNFTVSTSPNVNINILETTLFQLYAESTVQPGCFDTSLVKINVFERPYLDVGRQSYTMAVFASTVIGGNPTALSGGPTLTWSPAEYLNDANAFNPVASNTLDVTYTVTMVYGAGCLESDTVQVLIVPEVDPGNGFSPNGDGKNDRFVIDYIDQFPNNEVEIYNRWGDRLFYSKGYQDPWDGTFKGQPLPVGTYYYVIHLNHFAYKKPLTGPVTIFR